MNSPIPRFLLLNNVDVREPEITDEQILDALVEHFDMDRKEMSVRMAQVDFVKLVKGAL